MVTGSDSFDDGQSPAGLGGDDAIGGLTGLASDGGEEGGSPDGHDPGVLARAAGDETGAALARDDEAERLTGSELVGVEHDA
jgi:hypothetical protein